MKKLFLLLPLLFLMSCDAPQRTRSPSNWVNSSGIGSNPQAGEFTPAPTNPIGGTNSGSSGGTTPIPGFENCDISQKYQAIDIGLFGICQSALDETSIRFNPSTTSSVRTCLIPTYKESDGSSTYIGNPQCTTTTSNQIVSGRLYKDRQGFGSYPLNGVIVMKEPLLPEYYNCMQGYVGWPLNACPNGANSPYCAYWSPRCPNGGQTSAACNLEAKNYMASLCNAFKSEYSNAYVDIRLK